MVQFCIHCHNILLLKEHEERMAFYCPTCPYVFKIVNPISKVTDFIPKKIEEPSTDMNEIASSKTMGKFNLLVERLTPHMREMVRKRKRRKKPQLVASHHMYIKKICTTCIPSN